MDPVGDVGDGLVARGLWWRSELLAVGMSDDELRRLRRTGAVARVRPGAYVVAGPEELRAAEEGAARHRLAVLAAVPRLAPGAVISHVSAAVMHGLPIWFGPHHPFDVDRVRATRDRRSGARRSTYLDLHAAALEPDEVVAVDGVPVTSIARTVADLARTLPLESALVPADAALHRHLVTRAELDRAVELGGHRRGNTAARRLVAFADGGAESPGESRSRLALHRAGLPAPVSQHEVRTPDGRLRRVDFWWECGVVGEGVVGEFDGRVKYGRLLRPGQEPGEAVFAEKLREDALRAAGLAVVRWTWADLADFTPVAARIRAALSRP
ncbi:type IV toxin-antitoxin system AbiEi family antitoxin domain-containing protein [Pseudonocardia lacus]|uniref:type IV toxin-antitoxin system AbiEi family antitoxin domain-containing protein n=1 Tax=Pseudonocardia lacus TaxID=2835865 RepID=UPI001BDDA314|nr:hypothetical protein [Pseudonocardia lacus]